MLGSAFPISGAATVAVASQTIVQKLRDGRFLLIYETEAHGHYVFSPAGPPMTLPEICNSLIAQGISEEDTIKLLKEAESSFNHP